MLVLLAGSLAAEESQAPSFYLSFPEITLIYPETGIPGTPVRITTPCELYMYSPTPAEHGAEAWSIGISSEGLEITDITVAGTAAADVEDDPPGLRNNGFMLCELTSDGIGECSGLRGAVSTVVLSHTSPVTLPPNTEQQIARITLSGTYPDYPETVPVRVFYVDGCRGTGDPVENLVKYDGVSLRPNKEHGDLELHGLAPCPQPDAGVQLVVQAESTGQTGDLFAELVPTPDPALPAEVTFRSRQGTLFAAIVSQLEGEASIGVQGWSLAASVIGDIQIVGATTAGTVAALNTASPPGLRVPRTSFERTELCDPNVGYGKTQGQGAVSAVVLSFMTIVALERQGTATVLALTFDGEDGATGQLRWQDGMRGHGDGIVNVATVDNGTSHFQCTQWVNIRFQDAPGAFRRGDANDDAKMDLSDAVAILSCKFLGTGCPGCRDAMDSNDDGRVDVSDPIYILGHLFLGGPPLPYPAMEDCGEDPTEDDLPPCQYESCF